MTTQNDMALEVLEHAVSLAHARVRDRDTVELKIINSNRPTAWPATLIVPVPMDEDDARVVAAWLQKVVRDNGVS